MNDNIKISLITVTFNAEKTLLATLKSVIAQDYSSIEHVLVDGESKDGTMTLIEKYSESILQKNGRDVKYISERDNGIYDAMNKGIALSTGDYICFLNAGDSLHAPDTLTKLVEKISADTAVIYGDTDIVNEEGIFLHKRRLSPPEKLSWKSFRNGMLVCHQSFYVKREIAELFSYDMRYKHSADFDWCIRIMKYAKSEKVQLTNSHLILTDYLEEGHTTKFHKASLRERFNIMCKYYGYVSTLLFHIWFLVRNVTKR